MKDITKYKKKRKDIILIVIKPLTWYLFVWEICSDAGSHQKRKRLLPYIANFSISVLITPNFYKLFELRIASAKAIEISWLISIIEEHCWLSSSWVSNRRKPILSSSRMLSAITYMNWNDRNLGRSPNCAVFGQTKTLEQSTTKISYTESTKPK